MMRKQTMTGICALLVASVIGNTDALAAKKAVETPLTATGQKLEQRYAGMLAKHKAEIAKAIPQLAEQKKAAYLKTRDI
jgi:hypothetical protein